MKKAKENVINLLTREIELRAIIIRRFEKSKEIDIIEWLETMNEEIDLLNIAILAINK
jgi:hypothetical protein